MFGGLKWNSVHFDDDEQAVLAFQASFPKIPAKACSFHILKGLFKQVLLKFIQYRSTKIYFLNL